MASCSNSNPNPNPHESTPTPTTPPPPPPWIELPPEITTIILLKLGAIEMLTTSQYVCRAWRNVCREASTWKTIDMRNEGEIWDLPYSLVKMCHHAIDLSQGNLIEINIEYFGTDDLLLYIGQRCRQLKSLRLAFCYGITGSGVFGAVQNLPLLEKLHLYYTHFNMEAIEDVGHLCPRLTSFIMNSQGYKRPLVVCDLEALAIAESMPELRHLELFGNKLTNEGLKAILDGCPYLESLDLRQCFNVNLGGELGKLCSQRIKHLRGPNDSTDDYKYNSNLCDDESSEDEHITGFSDIDMISDYEDYLEFSGGSVSSFSINDYDDYYDSYDESFSQ